MPETQPRFEFRSFSQDFGPVEEKMRRLSPPDKIRESMEIYIMSAGNHENNTKIRDNLMDIKVFVKEQDGFEQWNPRMKGEFPMSTAIIREQVFPAFGVRPPEFSRAVYTLPEYLSEIIRPHPELQAVHIFKRRFGFMINGCIAEVADVFINGAKIRTASLESVDTGALVSAREMVGLEEYENVNYLKAIKRVIGMMELPDSSVYKTKY